MLRLRLLSIGLPLLLAVSLRAEEKLDPKQLEFFEDKVRPILAARCFECHGPEMQKGGLRLDSAAAVRTGGDSGAVIEPGKPEDSLLVTAIGYRGDLKMPPKSRLPASEIATLTEWIKRGASWPVETVAPVKTSGAPSTEFTPEQKAFWAFQPVREPDVPAVRNADWCRSPLDRFVLAELERNGLSPAPAADRRTLIRRATFDLTGLPPTPEEIAAFLADESPEAFGRVVDRLLASPRHGERWGRHWLDVARYADSNGLDENLAYGNAFRYRDYVIAAFNADKPYDVFVQEQLAGDLLPAATESERLERIVATGFLCLGAKMLAEDDPVKMQMDIIDEQVDTIGRTFLGLTLGCARCHDHKFDPLLADDYYALAGIFKSTKTMDNFSVVARWQERPLVSAAEQEQLQKQKSAIASRQAEAAKLRTEAGERLLAEERRHVGEYLLAVWDTNRRADVLAAMAALEKDDAPLKRQGAIVREAEDYDSGNVIKDTTSYGQGIGVLVNRGELPNVAQYSVQIADPSPPAGTRLYLVAIRVAAADSRPCVLTIDEQVVKPDAAGVVTGSWTPESQRWALELLLPLAPGKHTLKITRDGPFPHIDKLLISPTDLVAPPAASTFTPKPEFVQQWTEHLKKSADSPLWAKWREAVAKGEPVQAAAEYAVLSSQVIDAWQALKASNPPAKSLPDPVQEDLRKVLFEAEGPFALPEKSNGYFPPEVRKRIDDLQTEIAALTKSLPQFPEAMAVSEDRPQNLKVHLRGSHLTLGREVPRQFPRILEGNRQSPIPADRSGRLDLAMWLTRPDHPLTARVMVNRIWQGHFGEGLVRSPDNFGRLGDRPTHPALLDWLARQFVEEGWSMKRLHRTILLSSTWQQSARHDPRAALADPENRLLWRMNRRRLEVEAIRDAMLAAAGTLDARFGGTQLPTPNRQYVTSTANVNPVAYDGTRRSVYLPVVRSALYEVFQAFDFADPSVQNGRRDVTTVAPQALFMMNSPFVSEQSTALAKQLLSRADLDDAARVRRLWEQVLGQAPSEAAVARALGYVDRYATADATPEGRQKAWQSLCRTLLASNEFVYVD